MWRVCPRTTHCARDPTPARTAAVRTGGHETSEHAEAKASSGEASESEVVVSRAACGRPRAALRRMWRLCGLPRLENASALRTTSVAMSSRIMGAGRTDLMTSMLSPVYHVHCVEVAASQQGSKRITQKNGNRPQQQQRASTCTVQLYTRCCNAWIRVRDRGQELGLVTRFVAVRTAAGTGRRKANLFGN